MSDNNEPKHPRLYFLNQKGVYAVEHVPPRINKFEHWLRNKYVKARDLFGMDIYYWHLRHTQDPEYRKSSDIEFMMHVIEVHENEPTDRIEKRHYKRALALYINEIEYVTEEIEKDKGTKWENDEIRYGHPYAYAYFKQWYKNYPEVATKLLYHGVSYVQYASIMNLIVERDTQRRDDYCKEQGLNPETGEKLGTQENPKKAGKHAKKHDKKPVRTKQD